MCINGANEEKECESSFIVEAASLDGTELLKPQHPLCTLDTP